MNNVMTNEQMDIELERMVNANHAARRARERKAMAIQTVPARQSAFEVRLNNLKRFCDAAWRAGLGMVFLGAVTRAWVVPGFGVPMALACFVWGWFRFRRGTA